MNLNHTSIEIYFIYAFTYYKLRVFKTEEDFIMKVLMANRVKLVKADTNEFFQEVDTRLLGSMIKNVLTDIMKLSF